MRDSVTVDRVVCSGADVEQRIKTAISINSSYVTDTDTTLAVSERKVVIRLGAPDGTAMALGK